MAGILQQILLPEGTTAAVKTDMAIIGDEAVDAPHPRRRQRHLSPTRHRRRRCVAPADVVQRTTRPPAAASSATAATTVAAACRPREPNGTPPKRFYTPVVLRMAEEHDIDLATIRAAARTAA